MDQQLSSDIKDSIVKIETKIGELKQVSTLNTNLKEANQALSDTARALSSASGQFPSTLTEFKSLSDRLSQLAKILEGSDLAVLVGNVDKLDIAIKDAKAKNAEAAGETATKLQAIKGEVDSLKVALRDFSEESNAKFQAINVEMDETKALLDKVLWITEKKAAQGIAVIIGTSAMVLLAIAAARFIT